MSAVAARAGAARDRRVISCTVRIVFLEQKSPELGLCSMLLDVSVASEHSYGAVYNNSTTVVVISTSVQCINIRGCPMQNCCVVSYAETSVELLFELREMKKFPLLKQRQMGFYP